MHNSCGLANVQQANMRKEVREHSSSPSAGGVEIEGGILWYWVVGNDAFLYR